MFNEFLHAPDVLAYFLWAQQEIESWMKHPNGVTGSNWFC
jgi:hypothetical protein